MNYKMLDRMTEEDQRHLKEIWAPQVVAVPPSDARRDLCVLPNGEIRCYGVRQKTAFEQLERDCYIASTDGGLTWKMHDAPGCLGACVFIPQTGEYLTVTPEGPKDQPRGLWVRRSMIGPDDTQFIAERISDLEAFDVFQPKWLGQRLAATAQVVTGTQPYGDHHPVFIFSDDCGKTWNVRVLPSTPRYEVTYPDISPRWNNNGGENVVELMPDGRLMLLARTSTDFFYIYWSQDGGDTWTEPEPSPFHGTLTTPFFLKMSDGRILLFFNSTQPMPERNHANEIPTREPGFAYGWENVFTNRDANHCAVTVDGVHWRGFREMYLHPLRNHADYRTHAIDYSSRDRSVHQFQAVELPFGKVLVAFGQSTAVRKLIILDPDWLLEKGRKETFERGLMNVSTHLYVKSYSDAYGIRGHCQWNRTNGALLVPSPEMDGTEALQICRITDPRLLSDKQGMVWNFPMARKGEIRLRLRIEGEGLRVALCDHWFNPCDDTVGERSPLHFKLTADMLSPHQWHEVCIAFDVDAKKASVSFNGAHRFLVRMKEAPDFGLSYLHLMTDAEGLDPDGTLIASMEMSELE